LLTVAGLEYLHAGAEAYGLLEDWLKRSGGKGARLKVLLLHPWSEQAVSRALREDRRPFAEYTETNLWMEVLTSCTNLVKWQETWPEAVEGRLYKVSPACFLLFVNDVLFYEQYHFGAGGRASKKIPMFVIARGSPVYEQLDGHFSHVWDTASPHRLTGDLVRDIKDANSELRRQLDLLIACARPDLPPPPGPR